MSGQSYPQKPAGFDLKNLHTDRPQYGMGSSNPLSQFANATASGYQPQSQASATTYPSASSSNPNDTSQQGKPITMSSFHASAYEAALNELKPLQPSASQTIDLATFKGLKFVTLDGLQLETREIYDKISGTFQWEMCETDEDRCLNFVREKCANRITFLIASGSLGKKNVPEIHDLPQIYAIYIYCSDVNFHKEWTKNYPKVRVVCNDDDKYLLPQLAVDVAQANIDWGNALLKQDKRADAKKKFEKALENLTEYAKKPDPAMISEVKTKLEQCK